MLKKANIFKFLALALCLAVVVGLLGVTACNAGADGKDGKSAYDIWLEQGNTGTEQDFLDSLKGDKGDQGIQGSKGDKGDPGDSGAKGQNGSQWYLGTSADPAEDPAAVNAVEGDFYLDTKTFTLWQKTSSGWDETGSLKGNDGPKWFTGVLRPDKNDITNATAGSKIGDFYLCTEDGSLWRKTGTYHWDQIATLKGPKGDKGDPGESGGGNVDDDTFKLNVAAGQKADMPIALPAGTYVVEVSLKQKISFGRLEASVESSVTSYSSVFAFSQKRTDEASDGSQVYYGYVIVAEGDLKLTFAPTSDLKMEDNVSTAIQDAQVSITKWEQPTLKADGVPVEIILNSSNATADNVIKINLDESVGEGSYKITVNRGLQLSNDTLGIFDQTNTMGYGGQLAYLMGSETVKDITISASKNFLVFKQLVDTEACRYIVPGTVSLTKN